MASGDEKSDSGTSYPRCGLCQEISQSTLSFFIINSQPSFIPVRHCSRLSTFQIEESLFGEMFVKQRLKRRSDTWIYDHRHHAPNGQIYRTVHMLCTPFSNSLPFSNACDKVFLCCRSPYGLFFFHFFFISLISPHDSSYCGILFGNLQA